MSTLKRLDEKRARIRAGRATRSDFIIANSRDADMAFGVTAPGPGLCPPKARRESEDCRETLADDRQQIRDGVTQGLVKIVLLSASNLEKLAIEERNPMRSQEPRRRFAAGQFSPFNP